METSGILASNKHALSYVWLRNITVTAFWRQCCINRQKNGNSYKESGQETVHHNTVKATSLKTVHWSSKPNISRQKKCDTSWRNIYPLQCYYFMHEELCHKNLEKPLCILKDIHRGRKKPYENIMDIHYEYRFAQTISLSLSSSFCSHSQCSGDLNVQ